MLVLRDRLINVPLMSLQTGTQVGVTSAPIIDPRRLIIIGFYCDGPTLDTKPAVLHTSDIREASDIGFIIDSADDIMSPDGLVRLQEVINFNFTLEGKQVVEDGGRKIGKVADYTVDNQSYYIIKLHIKPSIWQSFSSAEVIIDRNQIKTVTDKQIVVYKADAKAKARTPIGKVPPIDNPFRKSHPQPEATTTKSN